MEIYYTLKARIPLSIVYDKLDNNIYSSEEINAQINENYPNILFYIINKKQYAKDDYKLLLKLINYPSMDFNVCNTFGMNIVMYMCCLNFKKYPAMIVRYKLIDVNQLEVYGNNLLRYALNNDDLKLVQTILQSSQLDHSAICHDSSIVMEIIFAIKKYKYGYRYLNCLMDYIKSEKCDLSYIDKCGNNALIYASNTHLEHVAVEMVATGRSNPNQINKIGNTALIMACRRNLETLALALLDTNLSNPQQIVYSYDEELYENYTNTICSKIDNYYYSNKKKNLNYYKGYCDHDAYYFACKNNMTKVKAKLEQLLNIIPAPTPPTQITKCYSLYQRIMNSLFVSRKLPQTSIGGDELMPLCGCDDDHDHDYDHDKHQ